MLKDDKEVKQKAQSCVIVTDCASYPVDRLLTLYSSWHRLRKAVAWLLIFKYWLRHRVTSRVALEADDVVRADTANIMYVQRQSFAVETAHSGVQSWNG
jgi:hypothetical protein